MLVYNIICSVRNNCEINNASKAKWVTWKPWEWFSKIVFPLVVKRSWGMQIVS